MPRFSAAGRSWRTTMCSPKLLTDYMFDEAKEREVIPQTLKVYAEV